MGLTLLNTFIAAIVIGFVTWLAGKRADLAGFFTAMPITTLIALALTHQRWDDSSISFNYAKSTLVAVPVSLLFFIPFLFAERLQINFWLCYGIGLAFLVIGFFIHRAIVN